MKGFLNSFNMVKIEDAFHHNYSNLTELENRMAKIEYFRGRELLKSKSKEEKDINQNTCI